MTFLLLIAASTVSTANTAWANDYFRPSEDTVLQAKFNLCEKDVESAVKTRGETVRIATWETCYQSAEGEGDSDLMRLVAERLAVLKFESQYSELKSSDPIAYAKVVLATIAQHPTADIPMSLVYEQWHLLIADHEARNNIPLRAVTIRIISAPGLTDEEKALLDGYLRRYAISAGFKAPEGYSSDAADSDIFAQVQVELESKTLGGSSRANLYEERFTLKASSVRFKKRGTSGEGIVAEGRADYVEMAIAKERAMEAVAEDFANELLARALVELFSNHPIPE